MRLLHGGSCRRLLVTLLMYLSAAAVPGGSAVPASAAALAVPATVAGPGPAAALAARRPLAGPAALPAHHPLVGPAVLTARGPLAGPAALAARRPVAGPAAPGGLAQVPGRAPVLSFRWPLDGVPSVVRRFDPPPRPWLPGHRGVDLAASPGAVVRSAGAGVVHFAGTVAGRGVVSVRHANGLRTTYEPVDPLVRAGDQVAAGAAIGTLAAGHLGCPAAACLHWGLRRGDEYLDPLSLLGRARVRLLPEPAQERGQALGEPFVLRGVVVDLRRQPQQAAALPGVDRDLGLEFVGDAPP
jgi:murein DD-endopeptidase MepM/ murein hydrolase activator NlpD